MGTPTAPALAGAGGPRGPGGPRSTSAPTGVGDDGSLAGTRSDTRPAPAAAARARNAATQTHPTGTVGRAARLWHARTPRPTGPAPRQGRARTRKARVSSRKASSTPPPRGDAQPAVRVGSVGSESTFLVPCSNPLQERNILSDLTDWHEGAPWRGSGSGPLRGNSNRYVPPYNHHCIRREPVALSADRGCDSNFTLSLALTLYCRLQIGFERYTLPGPTNPKQPDS